MKNYSQQTVERWESGWTTKNCMVHGSRIQYKKGRGASRKWENRSLEGIILSNRAASRPKPVCCKDAPEQNELRKWSIFLQRHRINYFDARNIIESCKTSWRWRCKSLGERARQVRRFEAHLHISKSFSIRKINRASKQYYSLSFLITNQLTGKI